jgi:hypothetical protein
VADRGLAGWMLAQILRWRWVFIGVAAVVIVGVLASRLLELGPVDPTDPGFKVSVRNDLGKPIEVKDLEEGLILQPGRSDIFEGVGPGQRFIQYKVASLQGVPLGCLNVTLDPSKTIRVNATSLTRC